MQATRAIIYQSCSMSRLIKFTVPVTTSQTVSGRNQNWLDMDGSASLAGVPSIMGAGAPQASAWWMMQRDCLTLCAPDCLWVCPTARNGSGPSAAVRSPVSMTVVYDATSQAAVGVTNCTNNAQYTTYPCRGLGYAVHFGGSSATSVPITYNSQVTGLGGGFGWCVWPACSVLVLVSQTCGHYCRSTFRPLPLPPIRSAFGILNNRLMFFAGISISITGRPRT